MPVRRRGKNGENLLTGTMETSGMKKITVMILGKPCPKK